LPYRPFGIVTGGYHKAFKSLPMRTMEEKLGKSPVLISKLLLYSSHMITEDMADLIIKHLLIHQKKAVQLWS
jgi:cyanate lyase